MVQRSLRLGDIVDDYCPRERRVTNHAVVAIVGDVIRQTRCSTCDAEHEYKEARVPKKKTRLDGTAAGSDLAGGVLVPARGVKPADEGEQDAPDEMMSSPDAAEEPPPVDDGAAAPSAESDDRQGRENEQVNDGWFSHRRLIRATLPRVEGETPPPRAIPEFTMHQRQQGRGFGHRGFRHGQHGNGGNGNGAPRDGNGMPDGNRGPHPHGGKPGRRRRRRRPR